MQTIDVWPVERKFAIQLERSKLEEFRLAQPSTHINLYIPRMIENDKMRLALIFVLVLWSIDSGIIHGFIDRDGTKGIWARQRERQ